MQAGIAKIRFISQLLVGVFWAAFLINFGFLVIPYAANALHYLSPPPNPWLSFLGELVDTGLTLLILLAFIALFRAHAHGEFFTMKNTIWLRWIGIYLLLKSFFVPIAFGFVTVYFKLPSHTFPLAFSGWLSGFGCILIAYSWILMEGVKLQQENDLTI